jgi:ABC-2 type transport system ATP-binding protein
MTPRSYLRFFADLYEVPRDMADERTNEVLDRLDLEYRDRRLGDMSKGMKRKVAIARSLVNDPDLLIYDEPASGLDPLTTNVVLEFVRELRDEGKTVVFSAHNLFHVESVCDRVVILNRGEIIARGTVSEIRAEHGETTYHVYTTVDLPETRDHPATHPEGDRFVAIVDEMHEVDALREAAESAGGRVADIRTDEASLEDIFLRLAREAPTTSAAEGGRGRS